MCPFPACGIADNNGAAGRFRFPDKEAFVDS